MNRGIQAAASGMIAEQKWLSVIANNLANVDTVGFKKDAVTFKDTLTRNMHSGNGDLGSLGSGAELTETTTVFEKGLTTVTRKPLDVAISTDEGLFAVLVEKPGQPPQIKYTRDGSFKIDVDGELATQNGHKVLDDSLQPIAIPSDAPVEIGEDGSIMSQDQPIAKLGVFTGQFTKEGDLLFNGAQTSLLEEAILEPGCVENSTVQPIEMMVQMITVSRSFELAQKAIQSQDEQTQKLIQSLHSS